MPVPTAFGPQFTVSTQNGNSQSSTSASTLADGRTVVVWRDFGSNLGDIKYRIFNADGTAAGGEVVVNANTAGIQDRPVITALTGGGFAIAWENFSGVSGDGNDIAYRVFNAAGAPVTGELTATNTAIPTDTGVQRQATIEATTTGGFVIGYWDGNTVNTGLTSNSAAMAREYAANGTALGAGPVRLSGDWGGDFAPVFAINSQGVAVVWDDDLGPDSTRNGEDGIYGRTYTGSPLPLSNPTDGGSKINSSPFSESPQNPDAAMVGSTPVFVWHEQQAVVTDEYDIMMKFGSNAVVRVNTTTVGDQSDAKVATLAKGLGFVVIWLDGGSGSGDIRARVYTAAGVPTSNDFIVSDLGAKTSSVQFDPNVTALIDGRFMVTWSDASNSSGIEARIFDPRTAADTWTGTSIGEQYEGTIFGDTLNGADGNDRIGGGGGSDTLRGSNGNDRLNGGTANDTMIGGDGGDTYIVDNAADVTFEQNALAAGGIDFVFSTVSRALNLNIENLSLIGGAAINGTGNAIGNTISGNAASNTLSGLAGNDILIGGGSRDMLFGGINNDTFDYNAISDSGPTALTRDVIMDFVKFQDKIDLKTIDPFVGGADNPFVLILAAGNAISAVATGRIGWYQENPAGTANDRTFLRINADADVAIDMVIELKGLIAVDNSIFVL